jgi:hypothetical protein
MHRDSKGRFAKVIKDNKTPYLPLRMKSVEKFFNCKYAYLIVVYSKKEGTLKRAEIWSSKPWDQSILPSDEYFYIAYETTGEDYGDAKNRLLDYISDINCPLHYLYQKSWMIIKK